MKDLPEIIIKYNRFLDPIFIFYCQNNPDLKSRGWNDWSPPPIDEVLRKVDLYEKEWKKNEELILSSIVNITGLSFHRNAIEVHIVSGNPRQFSYPVVIKSGFQPSEFVDVLTHELIHRLLTVNSLKWTDIVDQEYLTENDLVKNHILLHAILKYIFLDVLKEPKKLDLNLERSRGHGLNDYTRAWEIVDKEGYKKIIERFKSRTSSSK